MSKLQDIARERNWYKWFVIKRINVYGMRYLKLSETTKDKVEVVNAHIDDLIEMVDEDWKAQRKQLKQEKK